MPPSRKDHRRCHSCEANLSLKRQYYRMTWMSWRRSKKETPVDKNVDADTPAARSVSLKEDAVDKCRGGASFEGNNSNSLPFSALANRAQDAIDQARVPESLPRPAQSVLRSVGEMASIPSNIAGIATGCILFGSSLACSTWLQKCVLQISTGTTPRGIPSLVGLMTVALASNFSTWGANTMQYAVATSSHQQQARNGGISSYAESFTHSARHSWQSIGFYDSFSRPNESPPLSLPNPFNGKNDNNPLTLPITVQQVKVAFLGVAMFKLCGGRCWSIAPSSFTAPGSFGRLNVGVGCVPAPSANYITVKQRVLLRRMGQKHGCHTCGVRTPFFRNMFVGDHIPPNAVVGQWRQQNIDQWHRRILKFTRHNLEQNFFPQCKPCSSTQGGILATGVTKSMKNLKSLGGLASASHFHGFRYRNAFFIPGGIVAALCLPTRKCDRDQGEDGITTRLDQLGEVGMEQVEIIFDSI
jgi:hypothetical protein